MSLSSYFHTSVSMASITIPPRPSLAQEYSTLSLVHCNHPLFPFFPQGSYRPLLSLIIILPPHFMQFPAAHFNLLCTYSPLLTHPQLTLMISVPTSSVMSCPIHSSTFPLLYILFKRSVFHLLPSHCPMSFSRFSFSPNYSAM